jgi:pimeloyl-ACP methyl ester carboxylesterase
LIEETTGATLVTYDRPGFGESEIDPEHHGFGDDLERLESGLKELGYGGTYTLVAHSLGGFYATMFASRHPGQVKAAVLIDVNLACFHGRTPGEYPEFGSAAPGVSAVGRRPILLLD